VAVPAACAVAPRRWLLDDDKGKAEWERPGTSGCSSESGVRKRMRTSPRCWALAADKGGDAVGMAAHVGEQVGRHGIDTTRRSRAS
jgi:hypothetical protein